MRFALVPCLTWSVLAALPQAAAPGAEVPESFRTFLADFKRDKAFQLARTRFPLVSVEWGPGEATRGSLTRAEVEARQRTEWGLILSDQAIARHNRREKEKWVQFTQSSTPTRVVYSQGSKDTDTWQSEYVFERIEGRWFLVEMGGGGN